MTMRPDEIHALERADPGLLLALDALLVERNVTRAAAGLGLSQPALSARLARLRTLFADPLFTPAGNGRGIVPTPRALALADGVTSTLDGLRRLLRTPGSFDPATSRRTFVIAIREQPAAALLPPLVASLSTHAPRVRLSAVSPGPDTDAALENGECDLVVGPPRAVSTLVTRALAPSPFLCAQRRNHPRGTGPLTLDEYCRLDHLVVADDGSFSGTVDRVLAEQGRERRVALSVQGYGLAPLVVAKTDLICTLPARLLRRFADRILLFAPPIALADAALSVFWHASRQEDPGHHWLREQLYRAATVAASG